ncbi:hypothetical protein, conserved [Babesia ovata]|uniref:Extracellular matrix-binding ebh n=1 Tax=Babesia ovata TaxID=189622 RepID=A0A2H6KKA9_9APIC|nr:uncharacterized protein BOVATA_049270 [Babesia ovata]GBE63434.1 hypothetical protein, conserved [Babesia ovata]
MSTKAESPGRRRRVLRGILGMGAGATDKVTELETYLRSSLYKKREEMKTQIKTYITKQIQAIVDAAGKATSSNGVDVSGGQAALQGVAELGGNFKIDEQNVLVKALFTDLGGKVDEGLPNGGRGPSEQINLMDTLGEYRDKKQTLTGAITTIGSNVTQNLDGTCSENSGIIGDKNTFQQPFSQIKEQLTAIAGLVDSDQTKPDPPTKKTGVKNYLTDLEKMLTEQPNYPLTTQLDKTYTVQGLALIKTDIEALQKDTVPQLTSNLNYLCNSIKRIANEIVGNLEVLKNEKIGDELNKIYDDLSKLHTCIQTDVITLADKFIDKEADTQCRLTISLLHTCVDGQVDSAICELTAQSQKNYVSSVQSLLIAFAEKVQGELQHLPTELERDLETGHKGFMANLEKYFVKKVTGLRDLSPTSPPITTSKGRKMYPLGQAVMKLSTAFRSFYSNLKSQEDFTADSGRLQDPNDALLNLLNKLVTSQHFNQTFRDNVESLEKTFTTFSPQIYGEAESPLLLNALKNGFTSLVSELQKAYVSTYSQQKIRWDNIDDTEREKYAKIALTLTPTVYEALTQLKEGLEKHDELWTTYSIYNSSNTANALHKLFFRENGYDSKLPVNVAAGELNHKKGFTGNNILTLLDSDTCELFESSKQPLDDDTLNVDLVEVGVLQKLFDHLHKYFDVRHLHHIDKPRSPCSIYDMSLWLSGLPHNPVYEKLKQQIKTMFEVPSETDPSQKIVKPMNAHPQQFTHDEIHSALKEVTANAYSLLTGVVGHGDAATFYACEFPTNSLSLKYPSSGAECLDMLLDILRRIVAYVISTAAGVTATTAKISSQPNGPAKTMLPTKLRANQSARQTPKQAADQRLHL